MSEPGQGNAPLSLDTNLRLHPQRLNLGKAELLTDAITLPFTNIEERLNAYAIHTSEAERKALRSSMKSYLGRLNANPLLPLSFRLKVLHRFEKEMQLFDDEMTAALLNAHKIAIELVQHEAKSNHDYYAPLVEMITSAIELAVNMLQFTLSAYQATPVIATRQFFELSKLGFDIIEALDEQHDPERKRLVTAICRHELLRSMDFYSKTAEQQQMILHELAYHINVVDASLIRAGQQVSNQLHPLLLSNMSRPNDPPALMQKIKGSLPFDAIAISVSKLIQRLSIAVERIEQLQSDEETQKHALVTEEAIRTTSVGGHAILDAITNRRSRADRQSGAETHVKLEWECSRSFIAIHTSAEAAEHDTLEFDWRLINTSDTGLCIEQLRTPGCPMEVGSMIGITQHPSQTPPRLGFVSWMKRNRNGEVQLGIHYLDQAVKLVHANIESGSKAMNEKRSWPLLIVPGKGVLTAYFPENRIYRNMVFAINSGDNRLYFKVNSIDESGPNYSRCSIVRARTS